MYSFQKRPSSGLSADALHDSAERLAEAWWEGFAREDAPGLTALFSERASFWDPRFPAFAGRNNIGLYYEDLLSHTHSWGGRRSPVYLSEHGAFSVHTRSSFVFRPSGRLIDFPMVAFFKQHAGLVTDYEEYWDTGYMLKQLAIPAFPVRLPFLLPEPRSR